MPQPEEFLAKQYLAYEAASITWLEFLETIIPVFEQAGRAQDVILFQEFATEIQTTSYSEEKISYQSVDIHCEYADAIDSLRHQSTTHREH